MDVQKSKICKDCKLELPTSEFSYAYKEQGLFKSYCKGCAYKRSQSSKEKMKYRTPGNVEGRRKTRTFQRVNKNHYPDPEWVWTQIENGESPASFCEKLDAKYELKAHGNLNRKQKRKKK